MTPACTRVMEAYEGGQITRRDLLRWLPALGLAPKVMAQASEPAIRVRALNHITLTVSDPQRSLEFYQGLFGMPIQARQGATTLLRLPGHARAGACEGTARRA